MHTKRLKDLQGNSPNKTDAKDPKVIADIIALGHALTMVIPEGPAAELRRLTQVRERSNQRHTALVNQLQGLVAIIFPEFMQVIPDVKILSARYLLRECPAPQDIVAYGLDNLTRTIRKVSRGKLKEDRAKALYDAATASVGVTEGQESIIHEIHEILALMEAAERFTKGLEKEIIHYLKKIPYCRSILSLKGIKHVPVAGLIGEVGDFRRFKDALRSHEACRAGFLQNQFRETPKEATHLQESRPLLRKVLYFAALNTVRRDCMMQALHYLRNSS